jgi:uncharacterized protein (TIGR03067 family)
MTPLLVVRLGVAALLLGPCAGGAREEQERVQGRWHLVPKGEVGQAARELPFDRTITFVGDRMFFHDGSGFVLRFAPTWEPKVVDLFIFSPGQKDHAAEAYRGIYRLENNRLTIHFGMVGERRPTDFRDPGDKGQSTVWVLHRVRPK